jgi:hypothetical protein
MQASDTLEELIFLCEDSSDTDEVFQSEASHQASHIFSSLPLADNLIAADKTPKPLPITTIFFSFA